MCYYVSFDFKCFSSWPYNGRKDGSSKGSQASFVGPSSTGSILMIICMVAQELSWEDILIAYSTLPGYVANRDCTKGTWFVQSLCKIFMEHAHNTNLRDMLDLVALDLKQNFTSETGTKQSFNYDVRHFYKKLYFNPGLQVTLDIKV